MTQSNKPRPSPHHHEILVADERKRKGIPPTRVVQRNTDDRKLILQEGQNSAHG